jgi:cephalosporin hydroxylase
MKTVTRKRFEILRARGAAAMAKDGGLRRRAVDLLKRADRRYGFHQLDWLGEPVLQLPQDLFAFQEILFKTRPDYVVEVGTAWAGSLLYYSTLMEVLGGKKVIGVDVFVPPDLVRRIGRHRRLARRIAFIRGESTSDAVLRKVRVAVGSSKRVMIHLDSDHSHANVLAELRAYAPLVGKGFHLVCGDTIVEDLGRPRRPRPWGPGNSPATALKEFLKEEKRFAPDRELMSKLWLTFNPGGYLKRVR